VATFLSFDRITQWEGLLRASHLSIKVGCRLLIGKTSKLWMDSHFTPRYLLISVAFQYLLDLNTSLWFLKHDKSVCVQLWVVLSRRHTNFQKISREPWIRQSRGLEVSLAFCSKSPLDILQKYLNPKRTIVLIRLWNSLEDEGVCRSQNTELCLESPSFFAKFEIQLK